MLYVLALACFGVALVLGTLELLGLTPGAAGTVTLTLAMGVVFLGARALVNYGRHHHRHAH
jgi:hypothetical protein